MDRDREGRNYELWMESEFESKRILETKSKIDDAELE